MRERVNIKIGEKMKRSKKEYLQYLTEEELAEVQAADDAKLHWLKLNRTRASIVNRAVQRAKYDREKRT